MDGYIMYYACTSIVCLHVCLHNYVSIHLCIILLYLACTYVLFMCLCIDLCISICMMIEYLAQSCILCTYTRIMVYTYSYAYGIYAREFR